MAELRGDETAVEDRWLRAGRRALLSFGLVYAYSIVYFLLHMAAGMAVSGRVVSDPPDSFPWGQFSLLWPLSAASVASAAIIGVVAAYYLNFKRSIVVVALIGCFCGLGQYHVRLWRTHDANWQWGLELVTALLVFGAMVLTFTFCRAKLQVRASVA